MNQEQGVPKVHQDNPFAKVLKPGESVKEFTRKLVLCEISWIQSYVMGDPIHCKMENGRLRPLREDELCPDCGRPLDERGECPSLKQFRNEGDS